MSRSDRYTALAKQPLYYSDFTNNMDLNPDTGYLATLTNAEAVANSIRNLVLTNKFERFYQPLVGSKVQSLVFDPNDITTADLLIQTITETINNFEPRARSASVRINQYIDDNSIEITVIFSMLNIPEPFTFDMVLKRVR